MKVFFILALRRIYGAQEASGSMNYDSSDTFFAVLTPTLRLIGKTIHKVYEQGSANLKIETEGDKVNANLDGKTYVLNPEPTKAQQEEEQIRSWINSAINILFTCAIGAFVLHRYQERVFNLKPRLSLNAHVLTDDFIEDLCGCANDCDTCNSICCDPCRACRVTDTYLTAGLVESESASKHAAALFLVETLFCGIPFLECCYYPYRRSHLRVRLGGEQKPNSCFMCNFWDWLTMSFCWACALMQEARTVDRAVGVKTTAYTCRLTCSHQFPLGQAVRIGQLHQGDPMIQMQLMEPNEDYDASLLNNQATTPSAPPQQQQFYPPPGQAPQYQQP